MPVSKKRKKKGKPVKRGSDRPTGLSIQDLINVVAYQDYKEQGLYDDAETGEELPAIPTIHDVDGPTAEAVVNAVVAARDHFKEDQDGR